MERLERDPGFRTAQGAGRVGRLRAGRHHGARDETMKTAAKAAGLAVMVSGKSRKAEPEPTAASAWSLVEAAPVAPVPGARGAEQGPRRARCAPASRSMLPAPRWWCWPRSVRAPKSSPTTASIFMVACVAERIAGPRAILLACIYCQQLQAELLSIAGTFQLSDALPAGLIQEPVHIRLRQRTTSNRPHQIELQGKREWRES